MRVFRAGLPLWAATALMTAFLCVGADTGLAQSQDYDRLVVQFNQLVTSGQVGQAEEVAKQLQGVARDRFGAGSRQYAEALGLLGDAYLEQHKNADAEKIYRDALTIHKKRLGASNPENIIYLSQLILSVIRQNTRGANKTAEFEQLANELHGLLEEGRIPSTGIVALGLMETGRALYGFRLYEQAIYFLERAQHLYRAFNPTDPSSLLTTTHYLGLSYRQIGNLTDGERQLKDALAMADAIRSADGKARVEHDLANVLVQQGRKDEAIRLYEAALRTGGGNGIKTKGNLALLYAERGRFAEAERLLREQMQLLQNESPRNEQDIVETRANMIAVLGLSGKVNEAIPLIKDNMRHAERMKDDFLLMISKIALAGAYNDTNRHDEALSLLRQLRTDVTGQRKGFDDLFASFRSSIGQQLLEAGSPREAYDVLREAVVSGTQRYNTLVPDTRSAEKIRGAQSKGSVDGAETLVAAAFALAAIEPSRSPQLMREAFEAAQWSTVGDAGLAIAQLGARAAGPNAALSVQARSLQELTGTWRSLDERLLEVRRDPGVSSNPTVEIAQLTGEIKQIEVKLSTAARTISQQYPGYWALARPQPISLAKVQELLSDDEVLVLFDVQFARTFAWAVTKQEAPQWQRIDSSELADTIKALRCGLDETLWRLDGTVDCSKLVGREPFKEKVEQLDQTVLPFDLGRAHKLYSSLLAPFASQLRTTDGKARHLLLVVSGPLTSLPFNVLVTEPPATPVLSSLAAYRGVAWLGSRHAISVLPSVASLGTLGRAAGDSRAAKPYLGIGNPLLDGQQDDPKDGAFYKARAQAARDKQQCPKPAPRRLPAGGGLCPSGWLVCTAVPRRHR